MYQHNDMITKSQIQFIKSLTISKFRKENKQFIVEGPKIVDELIKSSFKTIGIFATSEWIANKQGKISDDVITQVSNRIGCKF